MTAVHIYNHVPHQRLSNRTPYELWIGNTPTLEHLHPFGCKAYALIPPPKQTKLGSRTEPATYLGPADCESTFRLLLRHSHTPFITCNANFIDSELGSVRLTSEISDTEANTPITTLTLPQPTFTNKISTSTVLSKSNNYLQKPSPQCYNNTQFISHSLDPNTISESHGEIDIPTENQVQEKQDTPTIEDPAPDTHNLSTSASPQQKQPSRRHVHELPYKFQEPAGKRQPKQNQAYKDFTTLMIEGEHSTPQSYQEAIYSDHADKWHSAMTEEYNALIHNGTFTLVPLPPNHKPIATRWLFHIKHQADGSIEHYKAH